MKINNSDSENIVYILIYQLCDDWRIVGVFERLSDAEEALEEERVYTEKIDPGCWELGGWKEEIDWANGGKRIKVRDGNAFKHCYCIEEHIVYQEVEMSIHPDYWTPNMWAYFWIIIGFATGVVIGITIFALIVF